MGAHTIIISIFILVLSLIFAFRKEQDKVVRVLPFFFLEQLPVESYSYYLWYNYQPTTVIYNLHTSFQIIFYLAIIGYVIVNKKVKLVFGFVLGGFILFTTFYLIKKHTQFNPELYMTGSVLIVFASIYYLYETFKLANKPNLLRDSMFWICTALLFMHTSSFMLLSISNYLEGASKEMIKNFRIILMIINYLFYVLLCLSLICKYIFKEKTEDVYLN